MAKGSYNYNPANIKELNKDRMRFELGDTMTEGGPDTSALTDEEIEAAIDTYPASWKRAKLMLLESLCRRFAYEPDTKTGPLTLSFHDRAKLWKEDYEILKKEVKQETAATAFTSNFASEAGKGRKPPYFHTGMQVNERTGIKW